MPDKRQLTLTAADRRRLVREAARLLGPADAEDAVQDAYIRALQAQGPPIQAAQAWLLTVVRNLAIDRLRRRQWMQQWLAAMAGTEDAAPTSPSAEVQATLRDEATRALLALARQLTPADGAALLLHEVFDASHAEIAQAHGKTEAASRQQLRRSLRRLRHAGAAPGPRPDAEPEADEAVVLRLYLQALRLRDPQALWALLRRSPIGASAGWRERAAVAPPATPLVTSVVTCGMAQQGAQLGLVLTLDGVTLCVLPLGVLSGLGREAALAP